MTIVGKILVFLNLVFALAVAGFLVVDFQTRISWKAAYDAKEREMLVRTKHFSQLQTTNQKLAQEIARLEKVVLQKNVAIAAEIQKRQEEIKRLKKALDDAKLENTASLAAKDALLNQIKQRDEEVALLKVQKRKLNDLIVKLQKENDEYLDRFQQISGERDSLLARNRALLERNMQLEKDKAKLLAPAKTARLRRKDEPNPPPFYIEGKIQKVEGTDKSLVLISLGSDHGIETGHTLDVYRYKPSPEYVGMIRIDQVEPRFAFGRLIRTGVFGSSKAPREGDIVASKIRAGD